MAKLLLFLFIIALCAYGMGVRVYLKEIPKYFQGDRMEHFRKLHLLEGKFMIGELLRDSGDEIELRMGRGSATFPRSEITKIEKLDEKELKAGSYDAWISKKSLRRPILTYKYEDSMMPGLTVAVSGVIRRFKSEVLPSSYKKHLPEMNTVDSSQK